MTVTNRQSSKIPVGRPSKILSHLIFLTMAEVVRLELHSFCVSSDNTLSMIIVVEMMLRTS